MLPDRYEFVVNEDIYKSLFLIQDMDYIRKSLFRLAKEVRKITKNKWEDYVVRDLSVVYMHEGSLDRDAGISDEDKEESLKIAQTTREKLKRKYKELTGKDEDKQIDKICTYLPGFEKAHKWSKVLAPVGTNGEITKSGTVKIEKVGETRAYSRKLDYISTIGGLVNKFIEIWNLEAQKIAEVLIEEVLMSPHLSMSWSPRSIYEGIDKYEDDDVTIVECFSGPFNNQRVIFDRDVDIILTPSKALRGVEGFSYGYPEGLDNFLEGLGDSKALLLMNPPFTESLTASVVRKIDEIYTEHENVVIFLSLPGFWDMYVTEPLRNIVESLDADWNYVEKDMTQSTNKEVYMKFLAGQVYGKRHD